MHLKGHLLFHLLFLTLFSFGQTESRDSLELPPPPPKEMNSSSGKTKIWQNNEYKIKLSVPVSWKTIIPNEGEIVSFTSTKKEVFAIRPYKFVFSGTADEIRLRVEEGFKSQFPNCKVVSSKVIRVGELEASDIILQGTFETVTGIYRGISFHNNVNSFIITCFYLPADKTKYEKTLNEILKSITYY